MGVFKMPDGVELDLKIYLAGTVSGQEVETVITLGGLTAFSDGVKDALNVETIVKANNLDALGSGWRIMTRDEIKDYRERQSEAEQEGLYSVGVDLS